MIWKEAAPFTKNFSGRSRGEKYSHPEVNFESYFLECETGARLLHRTEDSLPRFRHDRTLE
jgi:hypothetical protein